MLKFQILNSTKVTDIKNQPEIERRNDYIRNKTRSYEANQTFQTISRFVKNVKENKFFAIH